MVSFALRPLLVLAIVPSFGLLFGACGDSKEPSTRASSTSTALPRYAQADADKDNDFGAATDDSNNNAALNFGRAASPAERRAVAALLRRYYAAALAGDGPAACGMIVSSFAEAIGEDYGEGSAGAPYLQSATTCAGVLDLLFRHYHAQLAVEEPRLEVRRVRLVNHRGFAILSFGSMPEREISVAREGHVWKLQAMLDNELP